MWENVIGPFAQEDWSMLRYFKADIREMQESNDGDYSVAISKQKALYQDILKEYKN